MPTPESAWTDQLLDDGSVLAGRPLPPAVKAFGELRDGTHGAAAGALCVTERDLATLRTGALPLHLAVTGGAGALEAALRWVAGQDPGRVTLRRVSARLRGEEAPGRNARRIVAVLDSVPLPEGVEVAVAPTAPSAHADPTETLSPSWAAALDELALREVGVVLPAAAPWTAAAVDAALDRELPLVFEAADADDVVAALGTVRTVLDGTPPPADWLSSDLAVRTRRWCRAALVPDAAATAAALLTTR